MSDAGCLSESDIVLLAEGQQAARAAEHLAHIESCDLCRVLVCEARAELGANSEAAVAGATTLRPGGSAEVRYQLLEEVGRGGVGVVHRAFDTKLGRDVALKVLHESSQTAHGLLEESRAMAKVRHPNVVTVFDVISDSGPPFIVSEFVTGGTLRMWLRRHPPKARQWRHILELFEGVASGLHAAHQAGLVHRDLKPSNILLDEDHTPKVADFGLASEDRACWETTTSASSDGTSAALESRSTGIRGTPAYMSPEQAAGKRVDRRSDVFSFCVALWESLDGQRPFPEETVASRFESARCGTILSPQRRDLPPGVFALLRRGLSARAEERPADLEQVRVALQRLRTGRRFRRLGIAVATGALAVTTASALALHEPIDRTPTSPDATERAALTCVGMLPAKQLSTEQWQPVHDQLEKRDGRRAQLTSARMREEINGRFNAQHLSGRAACELASTKGAARRKHLAWHECLLLSRYQLEATVESAAASIDALKFSHRIDSPEFCEALGDEMAAARIDATTDPKLLKDLARVSTRLDSEEFDPQAARNVLHQARAFGSETLEMRALQLMLRAASDRPDDVQIAADEATAFALEIGSHFHAAESELARWLLTVDGTEAPRELVTARTHVANVYTESARAHLVANLYLAESLKHVIDGDLEGSLESLRHARVSTREHAPWRLPTILLYAASLQGEMLGEYQEMATTLEELAAWHESSGTSASWEIASAYLDVANAHLLLEQPLATKKAWEKAKQLAESGTPSGEVVLRLATMKLRMRSQEDASREVLASSAELREREGIDEQHPSDEELRLLEAQALILLGKLDEAEAKMQPAQQAFDDKQPHRHRGYLGETVLLARVALLRGQPEVALALLEEVATESFRVYPKSAQSASAAAALAEVEETLGKHEDAAAHYKMAILGLPGRWARASANARLALLTLRSPELRAALSAEERAALVASLETASATLLERPQRHARVLQTISDSALTSSRHR